MGVHRRRDLGQDHRPGEESQGGQGLRQSAGPHSQRIGRRIRRVQNRISRFRESHERSENRRSQATHRTGICNA